MVESTNTNTASISRSHQKRLTMTLALTCVVLLAEVTGSLITGSLALLVDAAHMLSDVSMLLASTITAVLMRRKPDKRRTWGWARLEVLTAATGAMVLLFVGLYALLEAIKRLFWESNGQVQNVNLLLFFGILGMASNLVSMLILVSQSGDNLNMRAAFLEVMNDALGSAAVVVSAIIIMVTGWTKFDSVAGALIALLMVPRAMGLLRKTVKVLMEQTPDELDLDQVRSHMERIPHVIAVHDLHASTVATGIPMVMAHVVVERDLSMKQSGELLAQLENCLVEHFPVSVPHTTFQIEPEGCDLPDSDATHQ